MSVIVAGIAFSIVLFVGILFAIRLGRSIGLRRLAEEGELASKGFGAVEGAIFGLLGLVLAFLFSGALARFDARRHLVIEEANAIGTAWLRVDLLPEPSRATMRDLFQRYLDSRIEVYRRLPDLDAAKIELAKANALQGEIWQLAVTSSQAGTSGPAPILLLPALNAMFDITTTRTEVARVHPPLIIMGMLGALTLACSLFAGYDMASRTRWNAMHSTAFGLVLSITVYVIIDLEYPRLGLFRMDDSDVVLLELRKTMN